MTHHHPKGWGSLNVALNRLVQDSVITGYNTDSDKQGVVSVQVRVEAGADQAEVLRKVRDALPEAFVDARIRTSAV